MPSRWGQPPWSIDAPVTAGDPPPRCDVVVVGAGFTGLSAAYHLARRGREVVVLEAERIGAGSSGRTGGLALEGTAAGLPAETSDCLGFLERLCVTEGIDCHLHLPGCREVEHGRAGDPRPAALSDEGLLLRTTGIVPGGSLHPGRLLGGLARAAQRARAGVFEGWPVRQVNGPAGTVHGERGTIRAAHIVLALNGYLPRLQPTLPSFRAAITLALCTAPLDDETRGALGFADGKPFYTVDLPYLWGRTLPDGHLVLGSGLIFPGGHDVAEIDLADRNGRDTIIRLERRARALHPRLAEVRIESVWGGPVAFRPDRNPIIARHPEAESLILTGAYAGHGVALSVRAGEMVARAIDRGEELPRWAEV